METIREEIFINGIKHIKYIWDDDLGRHVFICIDLDNIDINDFINVKQD